LTDTVCVETSVGGASDFMSRSGDTNCFDVLCRLFGEGNVSARRDDCLDGSRNRFVNESSNIGGGGQEKEETRVEGTDS
jgi:hypothetical protein